MNDALKVLYGKVLSCQEIGGVIRATRKSQGATQADLASLCGVGTRFISELENGKTTAELGKVLIVMQSLGLELDLQPRGWKNNASHSLVAS
jgi:y4mF family transcriptional regulator